MRAPQWVSDFSDWRWAPCVGLIAGSLLFVAFAILFIPTQFEASSTLAESRERSNGAPQRALFGASLVQGGSATQGLPDDASRSSARRSMSTAPIVAGVPAARGFSPVLDRPEPPAPALTAASTPSNPGGALVTPEPSSPQRELTAQ